MQMQIDCQWNNQSAWCTNKKVKRSLFGLGARCCIMFDSDKVCSFYKATPSPIAPPPCPQSNKKKELVAEEYINILEKKIAFLTDKIEKLTVKGN